MPDNNVSLYRGIYIILSITG